MNPEASALPEWYRATAVASTRPSVSAINWVQAAAISRSSVPTASTRAWAASPVICRPAAENSPLTNATRSGPLVGPLQSTLCAPAFVAAWSRALPLAPPAWVNTRFTSSAGEER